jgi:hypothetical protein
MKKRFSSCVVIVALILLISAGSVFAADDAGKNFIANKVGVGYQGMVAGSFLNGLSVRGWIGDRVGLEGSVFYGKADAEIEEYGEKMDMVKADLWMIEAKAMYAVVARSYSKFYVGGKLGYGQINMTEEGYKALDGASVFTPGVFIGSEWSFPQLPEVGFNFDIGYSWLLFGTKVNEDPYVYMNLNMSGINATFGIHYYF